MSTQPQRGLDAKHEINPRTSQRDTRPMGARMAEALQDPAIGFVTLFMAAGIMVVFPALADILFICALLLTWFIKTREFTLPIRIPRRAKMFDASEPIRRDKKGKRIKAKGDGIFFLGNSQENNDEVWMSGTDARAHMAILGTTGSGKAQPDTALVHTPSGWRKMGELRVGDTVSTPDGQNAPILGVFPQGKIDIYRITFEDGRTTEACGDHLWEVHHKHWRGRYKAGQSRAGLAKPRILNTLDIAGLLKRNSGHFNVILPEPVEKPWAELPLDPYLMGALLGDGNIGSKVLRFTTADEEVLRHVRAALPADMDLHRYETSNRPYDYYFRQVQDGTQRYGRLENGDYAQMSLHKALKNLGLRGSKSADKFIPACYLEASVAQRMALLQGLMDTDGTAGAAGGVSFSTSSKQLAEDVQHLVRSLGGIAKIGTKKAFYTHKGERRDGQLHYRISIRHPKPQTLFRLSRKAARVASYQYADTLKLGIQSIEKIGKKSARCILIDHPRHLYITDNYVVTHNTEALLGLCQNSLVQGSGFMFVDGKAQNKILFKIYDLCRAMGREDDILVMNFMTGAKDIIGPQQKKISNTMNPFSSGSSGMLIQIVVGLMSSSKGGDDMWKDRAISFVESLLPPLVYMRDHYGLMLDVNEIRKYFVLEQVEDLAWRGNEKYPGIDQVMEALKTYLVNLPGYDRNKFGKRGGQGDTPRDQHGYITMQLIRAFTSLADTYGHIVRTPLGEIDFRDVVLNRRILVVMLPSLEKSAAETSNLGKLIVQALKLTMVEGLGSDVEGNRKELEEGGAAALPNPYLCILDEYGYYAVQGFAVAFAQARSLGFSIVVGGQDLPSFAKADKEEAAAIMGNTGIKWFGKIEDPHETLKFALERAGKANITRASNFRAESGAFSTNYMDEMSASYENVDRISIQDIFEQTEGQWHVVWRSRILRISSFYVSPPQVQKVRLNHFIRVAPPDANEIDEIENTSSGIVQRLMNTDLSSVIDCTHVREITAAAAAVNQFSDLLPIERGIAAVVAVGIEHEKYVRNFRAAMKRGDIPAGNVKEGGDPELLQRIMSHMGGGGAAVDTEARSAGGVMEQDEDPIQPDHNIDSLRPPDIQFPDHAAVDEGATEISGIQRPGSGEAADVRSFEQMNVFMPPAPSGGAGGFGAEVYGGSESERARSIESALAQDAADDAPLLDYDTTLKGLEEIERNLGASEENATASARKVVQEIEEATKYPKSVPVTKSQEDIEGLLSSMFDLLSTEGDPKE